MSVSEQIENDLRNLANEAKKRHPELKEVAEQAINSLRQSSNVPIDSLLKTLQVVQATQNNKVQLPAIEMLQKLLAYRVLDSISVLSVLQILLNIAQVSQDELIQLKTLQTIMLMLNPTFIILTDDLVTNVWNLCIKLEGSKFTQVRRTASATIRQLINLSFHKLGEFAPTLQDNSELQANSIYESSLKLFRNVVEMAGGNLTNWSAEHTRMKSEGIDLLQNILESSNSYINHLPEFVVTLEQTALNLLKDYLKEDVEEDIGSRSIKCAVLVVESIKQGFELLDSICKLGSNRKCPEWQQTACLEAISIVCSSPELLKQVHLKELALRVLETLNMISHEFFAKTEDRQLSGKFKVKLIGEIVSRWADSLGALTEKAGLKLGEMAQFPLNKEQSEVEFMLTMTWKHLLPVISIILSNCWEEGVLQLILNCYQSFINISGTLNTSSAREAFLSSLSQFCLPKSGNPLTPKHIYTCKTLFNITHCLGSILDVKAWHKVLDTLHMLDYLLNTTTSSEDSDINSDLQILQSALESLFKNTHLWPDSTLLDLVSALGQLTLEFMETLATAEKKLTGIKVFGLEKMLVVAQTNLDRITLFWEMLAAYLDCICNSKYSEIRVLGIQSLSEILIKVFKHFIDYPPPPETEKWRNWQRTLFLSLHDLSCSGFSDTKEAVFQALYSILQSCGAQLDKTGWSMLLFILSKIEVKSHSQIGFKCLQLIINDFLQSPNLLGSLEKLITCISKFAHQLKDMNKAISAVGMYWNVADYLGRVGENEEDTWNLILKELEVLGEDERPDVRHSAIHSLHVALTTYGSCLESWQQIMQKIVLALLQRISSNYFKHATITQEVPILEPPSFQKSYSQQSTKKGRKNLQISIPTDLAHPIVGETPKFAGRTQKATNDEKIVVHHTMDTLEKQWEETYHIFTQNLGKLFRTYLSNLEKEEENILENPVVRSNWDYLITEMKEGINNGTTNIIIAVLKAVKELLSCPKVFELFFAKFNSSWEIFSTLCNRLQVSQISIPSKLISIILEDLDLIYSGGMLLPFEDKCLRSCYILLNCLLESSKYENTLSNCRLLPDQKEVFTFIDSLATYLVENQVPLDSHLNFVLKYCKYNTQDTHSDAICRKALSSISKLASANESCLVEVIQEILAYYKILLTLRFNNEAVMLMNVTCKGADPLWYCVGERFIELLPHVLDFDCWEQLVDILESILLPTDRTLAQLSRNNLEDIVKSGEELDMKIMEFVKQEMIPRSIMKEPELQWRLVTLLDSGCENYYRSFHDLSFQGSLSSVCLGGLFQLCTPNFDTKVAKRVIPVLISRCRNLLKKYSSEERISGQMPLPKARQNEVIELLKMLKQLEVPEGVLSRPGPKGHLIELFAHLSELITAKDPEVKEVLKDLFLEIGSNL